MTSINRSALVNYSAQQMYDLVNDIAHYPQFMQGCKSARVISQTEAELVGELTLAKAGIKYSFTTRNTLTPHSKIDMQLEEGAFSHFQACWTFTALKEDACKVSLDMEFEFSFGLVDFAMEKLFSSSANSQMDSLVSRAHIIYGQ
jgi:ribosome-associated toxin RatA of RatAB toxin-antitoxin module